MGTVRRTRFVPQLESLEGRELLDAAGWAAFLPDDPAGYRGDRLLVRYHSESAGLFRAGDELRPGMIITDELDGTAGLFEVHLDGLSVAEALLWFQADVRVAFAQPDYVMEPLALPNDPQFIHQWGLHNTGQNFGLPGADIDAVAAWDRSTGSGQVTVAVIDSGIDLNHPDLRGNLWRNTAEIAGNGIDDDGNGYIDDVQGWDFVNRDNLPQDDHRHGTHVAGIIGAVGNNGIGMAGVAWDVNLMPLKILNFAGTGYSSDAVKALNYAVANGAKVVNNSWGGAPYDAALHAAIQSACDQGVIYVAAAGNNRIDIDTRPFYPASYAVDNVVRVAATDKNDLLAGFSNWGDATVQLAAPGSYILSTLPNGNYGYLSGTSMAAPMVAGALALVWDQNPTWSYRQVIDRVLDTVDVLPGLAGKVATGGRLNLAKALEGGGAPPPPPPPPPPGDTSGPRVVAVAPVADGGGIQGLRLSFSEAIQASSFTAQQVVQLAGPTGALAVQGISPVAGSNSQFDISFTRQTQAGSYSITVGPNIRDLAGNAMDQNQNGILGEATADRYAGWVNFSPSGITYAATDLPKAISDNRTVGSSLQVGVSLPITDVNVNVELSHTWVGDLRLRLRGPTGKEVVLVDRRGGSGRNFVGTQFDDQAASSIRHAAAPFTGSFQPEGSLATFNGTNARGYWQLFVQDLASGNVGTLTRWSITFNSGGASATAVEKGTADKLGWLRQSVGASFARFLPEFVMFSGFQKPARQEWKRGAEVLPPLESLPRRSVMEPRLGTPAERLAERLLAAFAPDLLARQAGSPR